MQHLLGFRCVGYVEIEKYCQKLIRQRQEDGLIDVAPIFTDIRAFVSDGYAASYTGLVDVITGGFPCQPHSCAGKREGGNDERDLWGCLAQVVSEIQPRFVFLENVPGITSTIPSRCVCGRYLGWRRVDNTPRDADQGAETLHGRNTGRSFDQGHADIANALAFMGRNPQTVQAENQSMGRGVAVAYRRGRSLQLPIAGRPVPAFKIRAGGNLFSAPTDEAFSQEEEQRDNGMDAADVPGGAIVENENNGIEQAWSDRITEPEGQGICEICGWPMGDRADDAGRFLGTVLRDLAEMGFDAEWCVLGAVDAGAFHKRERIWIMAYNQESRGGRLSIQSRGSQQAGVDAGRDGQDVADADSGNGYRRGSAMQVGRERCESEAENDGNTDRIERCLEPRLDGIPHGMANFMDFSWPPEPAGVPRVATGIQNRASRLKAIGNGQVPQCAVLAWRILYE